MRRKLSKSISVYDREKQVLQNLKINITDYTTQFQINDFINEKESYKRDFELIEIFGLKYYNKEIWNYSVIIGSIHKKITRNNLHNDENLRNQSNLYTYILKKYIHDNIHEQTQKDKTISFVNYIICKYMI